MILGMSLSLPYFSVVLFFPLGVGIFFYQKQINISSKKFI